MPTTIQYDLPDLLHLLKPYQKPNNANFDQLEADYISWIDQSPFLSPTHKKAWKNAELALLISRAYPDSDKVHLRVCLDWMMLFLILEQLTDTPATTEDARRYANAFERAMEGKPEKVEKPGPVALINHLAAAILPQIEPSYHPRFVASNKTLADGVVQEAIDREQSSSRQTPAVSLESYIKTRRDSIGVRPFLDLARWTFKLDLSTEILDNELIKRMEDATLDMVAMANDLYSYRKEYLEDGAVHNHVTVAMHDSSTSVQPGDHQAAIDYTVKEFSKVLEDFNACKDKLVAQGISGAKVDRYVESMLDLVVGNIEWSVACRRYNLFEDGKTFGTVSIEVA